MSDAQNPTLYWLDLETTGLDPETQVIIEIAVLKATLEDPFNATHLYHQVLAWPGNIASGAYADIQPNEGAIQMHRKSGLYDESWVSGVRMRDVEYSLLDLIPHVDDKSMRPVLAGSSVHFDHGFLKKWMPTLANRFSHRYYDVSAVKLFARSLGMPKLEKVEAHRAINDIYESIDHAKQVAQWLSCYVAY